jgi:hypothetical protein
LYILSTLTFQASLGDYFPELLGKVYILHSNWLFHVLYGIVGVFLDPVTKAKIYLSSVEEFAETVEIDNLLSEHNGPKEPNLNLLFPPSTPLKPKK